MIMSSDPFEMEWMWAAAMSKFIDVETNYRPGSLRVCLSVSPDSEDIEPREQISIRLSNAFIARPELFGPNAKDDPKMTRASPRMS